jgi:outer membrane protein assembly factor BamB
MRRMLVLCLVVLAMIGCTTATVPAPTATGITPDPMPAVGDWQQFGYSAQRAGVNPTSTRITLGTVAGLHRQWAVKLPDPADSTPVVIGDVALPDGKHGAVIYVTTRQGALVALDAATGAQLWQQKPQGNLITNSSPAVDPSDRFVYSYGLDGQVHKYAVGSGTEVTGNGWPLRITRMTNVEKESSALTIGNDRLYVTTSGYRGDQGHYEGHVVSLPLNGGTATVWNSLCATTRALLGPTANQPPYCAAVQSGIWARAGAVVDPTSGTVYVATGNGPYTANTGGDDWGDSVIALSPDLTHVIDSYTPTNQAMLNSDDLDLGSASPAMLPRIAKSATPLLAVQAGKDNLLRVLNRQNLSSQGGPGHVGGEFATASVPGDQCEVLTQPAVWTDPAGTVWVIVADSCGTAGYQVQTDDAGKTTLHPAWSISQPGTSPVIAGSVLFLATTQQIVALNPQTGQTLWTSQDAHAGGTIGGVHWESPIVVNDHLYMTDDDGNLYAYGL